MRAFFSSSAKQQISHFSMAWRTRPISTETTPQISQFGPIGLFQYRPCRDTKRALFPPFAINFTRQIPQMALAFADATLMPVTYGAAARRNICSPYRHIRHASTADTPLAL